jgi:hypothetical protein
LLTFPIALRHAPTNMHTRTQVLLCTRRSSSTGHQRPTAGWYSNGNAQNVSFPNEIVRGLGFATEIYVRGSGITRMLASNWLEAHSLTTLIIMNTATPQLQRINST